MERLKTIADHYGYEEQSRQLIEEMAELMVAINKYARADKSDVVTAKEYLDIAHLKTNIIEEIADVEVMLEQIIYLLDCKAAVQEIKELKIKRQLKRIAESEV